MVASAQSPAPVAAPAKVSFKQEIAPILARKCITCHGPDKAKGGYRLHTFELLMKGGESKSSPVTAGHPNQSKLFQLITSQDPDDRMPQKDDPLPQATLLLFERWIKEGADFDGPDPKAALSTWLQAGPQPDPPLAYPRPVPVRTVTFRPDGKELAVGGYREVTIWDPDTGKLLRRIKNVAEQTDALVFDPKGKWLAVAGGSPGRSGEVKLFDPQTGALLRSLATSGDMMIALALNADGSRLACGGADNAIHVFETATGKQELLIEQHADWIMALAFDPAGARLASASRDKSARVFNAKNGDLETTYLGHGEAVFGITFSADGKNVCSAGRDRNIHVWEAEGGKKIDEIGGFEGDIYRLIASSNSLFSCSTDARVRQHALTEKKAKLARTFSGADDFLFALDLHLATRRVAAGSFTGEIRIWNIDDGELLNLFTAAPGYQPPRASSNVGRGSP